jgi:hypothetical protein
MTMTQFNTPRRPLQDPGFFRDNASFLVLVALFVAFAVFGDSDSRVQLGTSLRTLVTNLLQWVVAAVAVVAVARVLWPLLRPFVCVAAGLGALWVLFRLGLFL